MITLSVGESRPRKFKLGAWLIRFIEGTDHSHTFVSWRCPYLDVRKVAEARGSGGRIIINKQFRADNEVVRIFQYKFPKDKLNEIEHWIWENLRPYGFKSIIGIALMRIAKAFGLVSHPRNIFRDGAYSMICAELTARTLELSLGTELPGNIEDYGLREMHQMNFELYRSGLCDLASDDLIKEINN